MEGNRNIPPAHLPPSTPGNSSGRFSVGALEEEITRSSSRRRRSTHTSRSRRAEEESSTASKIVWLGVAVVAMGYLGLLAFQFVSPKLSRHQSTPVATKPAAENATDSVATEAAPPGDAQVSSDLPPATDLIAGLKRSKQLVEDGRRLARSRQFSAAEISFEEAARYTPNEFSLLMDWAHVLREQNRWAAARDVMVRALAASPTSIPARLGLAQLFYQLKQYDDALAMAGWVIEEEPYSEAAHQVAADVHAALNNPSKSVEHLKKLVAINSANHVAENSLGAAYLKLGQTDLALKTFENVIRDEPDNSQAYYYLTLCFVQKNEPELAMDTLLKASARFGVSFVSAWTRSAEFDPLRNQPSFLSNFAGTKPDAE